MRILSAFILSLSLVGGLHAASPSESWTVQTQDSALKWTGTKVTGQHFGHVGLKKGTLQVHHHEIVGGDFSVDLNSITAEDLDDASYAQKLVTHLKSEDFFHTEKHPEATFRITSVKKKKSAQGTHEVTGELTLKGVTQPLSFPAHIEFKGNSLTAQGQAVVDRTKWNVRYGSGKFFQGLGDKLIHDTFSVEIKIVAKK